MGRADSRRTSLKPSIERGGGCVCVAPVAVLPERGPARSHLNWLGSGSKQAQRDVVGEYAKHGSVSTAPSSQPNCLGQCLACTERTRLLIGRGVGSRRGVSSVNRLLAAVAVPGSRACAGGVAATMSCGAWPACNGQIHAVCRQQDWRLEQGDRGKDRAGSTGCVHTSCYTLLILGYAAMLRCRGREITPRSAQKIPTTTTRAASLALPRQTQRNCPPSSFPKYLDDAISQPSHQHLRKPWRGTPSGQPATCCPPAGPCPHANIVLRAHRCQPFRLQWRYRGWGWGGWRPLGKVACTRLPSTSLHCSCTPSPLHSSLHICRGISRPQVGAAVLALLPAARLLLVGRRALQVNADSWGGGGLPCHKDALRQLPGRDMAGRVFAWTAL